MPTRPYTESLRERDEKDPGLRSAILTEAAELFLNGEADTARIMFHDYVKATMGFEALAQEVGKDSASIKRMLGPKGNPTANNLAALLSSMSVHEGRTFHVDLTR